MLVSRQSLLDFLEVAQYAKYLLLADKTESCWP